MTSPGKEGQPAPTSPLAARFKGKCPIVRGASRGLVIF